MIYQRIVPLPHVDLSNRWTSNARPGRTRHVAQSLIEDALQRIWTTWTGVAGPTTEVSSLTALGRMKRLSFVVESLANGVVLQNKRDSLRTLYQRIDRNHRDLVFGVYNNYLLCEILILIYYWILKFVFFPFKSRNVGNWSEFKQDNY